MQSLRPYPWGNCPDSAKLYHLCKPTRPKHVGIEPVSNAINPREKTLCVADPTERHEGVDNAFQVRLRQQSHRWNLSRISNCKPFSLTFWGSRVFQSRCASLTFSVNGHVFLVYQQTQDVESGYLCSWNTDKLETRLTTRSRFIKRRDRRTDWHSLRRTWRKKTARKIEDDGFTIICRSILDVIVCAYMRGGTPLTPDMSVQTRSRYDTTRLSLSKKTSRATSLFQHDQKARSKHH